MPVQCACVVRIGNWSSFQSCCWWWWCNRQDHQLETWSGSLTVLKGPTTKALWCTNRTKKDEQERCRREASRREARLQNNGSVTRYMYIFQPLDGTVKNGKRENTFFTSSNKDITDDNLGVIVMKIHFTYPWINPPLKLISWLPTLFVLQGSSLVFKNGTFGDFLWYTKQLKSPEWRRNHHL